MSEQTCDYPECEEPAEVLIANSAGLTSPEYRERWSCSKHIKWAASDG